EGRGAARAGGPGPHKVGPAPLVGCGGGRVVAEAPTPESGQGRRAKRALTRFVPGGLAPQTRGTAPLLRRRGERVVAEATTPESGQGRRAKRALTRFVPGGRPPRQGGRRLSSGAVGGVLRRAPPPPNLGKAEGRSGPWRGLFLAGLAP